MYSGVEDPDNRLVQKKINYNSNGVFGEYDLAEGLLSV